MMSQHDMAMPVCVSGFCLLRMDNSVWHGLLDIKNVSAQSHGVSRRLGVGGIEKTGTG
jgi:hypothetical protein